jgi:hypothetical protein
MTKSTLKLAFQQAKKKRRLSIHTAFLASFGSFGLFRMIAPPSVAASSTGGFVFAFSLGPRPRYHFGIAGLAIDHQYLHLLIVALGKENIAAHREIVRDILLR